MNEQIGRHELDAMRKAAGIEIDTQTWQDSYSGEPETRYLVRQDGVVLAAYYRLDNATAYADELAMDLVSDDAIGAAVEAEA